MSKRDNDPSQKAFQAYLETLAGAADDKPDSRQLELLRSYAELQFRLKGGQRCSLCGTPVRHVMAVTSEHDDGKVVRFDCLCTRCFEAEKALAAKVSIGLGETTLEFTRAKPAKLRARRFVPPSRG